jgi:hypothetical protein
MLNFNALSKLLTDYFIDNLANRGAFTELL